MSAAECSRRYLAKPGHHKAHRLQCDIRQLIRGVRSSSKLPLFTGISNEELLAHLESTFLEGMSWENYGRGSGCWQVDHIRPKSSFNLGEEGAIEQCFHYTNLRALWASDNAAYTRTEAIKVNYRSGHSGRTSIVDKEKARAAGLKPHSVRDRIRKGWPEEDIYKPNQRPRG